MVAEIYDPRHRDADAGGWQVPGQPGKITKALSQKGLGRSEVIKGSINQSSEKASNIKENQLRKKRETLIK